MYEIFLDYE